MALKKLNLLFISIIYEGVETIKIYLSENKENRSKWQIFDSTHFLIPHRLVFLLYLEIIIDFSGYVVAIYLELFPKKCRSIHEMDRIFLGKRRNWMDKSCILIDRFHALWQYQLTLYCSLHRIHPLSSSKKSQGDGVSNSC